MLKNNSREHDDDVKLLRRNERINKNTKFQTLQKQQKNKKNKNTKCLQGIV